LALVAVLVLLIPLVGVEQVALLGVGLWLIQIAWLVLPLLEIQTETTLVTVISLQMLVDEEHTQVVV
jgi:hypothetical protein